MSDAAREARALAPGPVVLDVEGLELTAADRARLAHPLTGMVILFGRNFDGPEQLRELTAAIHAERPGLLIAVDHEGGRVQRFRTGFTRLPPMRRLGERWNADVLAACRAAASLGYVLAAELRAHGVDYSFTPVLDLDWGRSAVIGDRAFHRDARVVTLLAAQLMHGLRAAGMSNCGKHFPGHGWAEADSHTDLPVDERAEADVLADDAAPYGWLAPVLDGVMPAHLLYPRADALPAGFSPHWLTLLRERMGFTGAIFSDDLTMEGARGQGDIVARGQAALDAGCDLVLVCNRPDEADRLLRGLRWQRSAAFEARWARLQPQGAAPSMAALAADPRYRLALADLAALTLAAT